MVGAIVAVAVGTVGVVDGDGVFDFILVGVRVASFIFVAEGVIVASGVGVHAPSNRMLVTIIHNEYFCMASLDIDFTIRQASKDMVYQIMKNKYSKS